MFCAKDQRDVMFCTCPDIHERMSRVAAHPNIHIAPDNAVVSTGPRDRPVLPTTLQPVFTPERGITGMTRVRTKSGSEYVFTSQDGKSFVKRYSPAASSRVGADDVSGQHVTFSEYPIEPGYPLSLQLENGFRMHSTVIEEVDYDYVGD